MKVTRHEKGVYSFKADEIDKDYIMSPDFVAKCAKLRGSVMVVGPLLARFGQAYFPKPGGDQIGRRRVDTHILGFMNLGADQEYDTDRKAFYLHVPEGRTLEGKYMLLDEASVTGTANIVMAATLAKGVTTIYNAACEPYVQQLCRMLVRMGAKIEGIGSNLLTITGVDELHGTEHRILPDMIEIGSFIALAAVNKSAITIKDVAYDELGIIPECFRKLGVNLERRGDDIYFCMKSIFLKPPTGFSINQYRGFTSLTNSIKCSLISSHRFAYSVIGDKCPFGSLCLCVLIAATLYVVQSGLAHITSGMQPQSFTTSFAVIVPISTDKDGLKRLSQSTVYTVCPLASNAFAIDLVPQNKSKTTINAPYFGNVIFT